MDLSGKVALVTGGGRGIGRSIAIALVQAGCHVVVLARTHAEVDQVATEIEGMGHHALAVTADLSDLTDIAPTIARIREQVGPVTILVNNAAMVEPLGQSVSIDPFQWAQALTVNLSSVFALIQATLPDMLAAKWGRIVSVSSGVAAGSGMNLGNAYAVSKAGLEMLTRNLAVELDDTGITVNAVRPGIVDTVMQTHIRTAPAERIGNAMKQRFTDFHESGSLIAPELPAQLIVQVIAGTETGEVISIGDARGQALLSQAQ